MPTDSTERKLRAALERLIAGHPIRSEGKLTVTGLAREASVSRATAHRYPDVLADLAAASNQTDLSAGKHQDRESALVERNEQLVQENVRLRAEKEALATALYALTDLVEQKTLADESTKQPGRPSGHVLNVKPAPPQ